MKKILDFSKFIYKRFDRVLQRYFSDFYHMKQRRDKHTNPTVQTVFKQALINKLCSCVSPIISYDKIRTLNMIITLDVGRRMYPIYFQNDFPRY